MRIAFAQYPEAADSADRIFTTDNALIVLDGATAFIPVSVSAQTYAEDLGRSLQRRLIDRPSEDLSELLGAAIEATAATLNLGPDDSPSATVTIIRCASDCLDVLLLGDNTVIVGPEPASVLTDDRLNQLDFPEAGRYRERLLQGSGYDDEHNTLLEQLQRQQRAARNRPDGYWIAERDPSAAREAFTYRYPMSTSRWLIAMTDGAAAHLALERASEFADYGPADLAEVLKRWHRWEHESDPDGRQTPRAKRSDDKAIAVVRMN